MPNKTVQQVLGNEKQRMKITQQPKKFSDARPKEPRKPNCDHCGDAKFVRYEVPVEHPRFGKIYPCPKCNQLGITQLSGLNLDERKLTLNDLIVAGRPDAARMKSFGQAFIEKPTGFLSVCGGWGTGKTIMLAAIVNAMLEKGIEARYLTGHTLMDYLYEAFDPEIKETDRGRITRLASIPVLVIDEFHQVRETPYAVDMYHHLINERYRERLNIGTVFAWNGALKDLPWPAVQSRLSEYPIIENHDPDMREIIGKGKTNGS